ncbi:Oxysterol-binding protein [Aspergillus campestris IBT 28561]|uniref:Oxysterol-binding protein n=1 Tax=Aspergillus campestris (strain IBT 28561) TaxID=1392248 RepID=A0A2I1D982_ASPC2|nr:Oxysterol-binding protein [Aspergillus campestris IBT 28561]PKY06444.1 Oxysterol-binding protein [Aspergillus campestris IBT 28561]
MSADWGSFFNITGARSSLDEPSRDKVENTSGDDELVEPDQGNVLSHIISQLRPGADLSRVVLPTFILEPRSMLERITNFMAHPETLLPMSTIDDPLERFISVVKFYLSGWHIKPPGVKKPLNPILGETFTCYWDYPDGTRGYYISEQTSHHPPKSSYFFMAPEHNIRIDGTLKPHSKFLGNSAASMMEGIAIVRLLNRGEDKEKGERYIVTQPNMYARGILFGKMKYELGDHSYVRCPENNLVADIEFKTKGYFSGTYNAIGGTIKNEKTGEVLYELSGFWNGDMQIRDVHSNHKDTLFDASHAKHTPPTTRPIEQQGERESQRLWENTVKAIIARDHEVATDEKTKIEDRQREEAAKRAEHGVEWHPHLFRPVHGGPGGPDEGEEDLDWIINANVDPHNPEHARQQILAIAPILEGQPLPSIPEIPPHHPPAGQVAAPEQAHTETTETAPHTDPPAEVLNPTSAHGIL